MRQTQRILLLGSSGYLGRVLMAQLQPVAHVVPAHRTHAHAASSQRYDFWTDSIDPLVEQHQISTVVIAANMAYESAESDRTFAHFKQRAERLVVGCQRCRVIYISSDGIFDGKKGNYVESDLPTPLTPYGRNLHYLEEKVRDLCAEYCIIRPSYLYGYSLAELDRRLSHARRQLLAGERLPFFTDMIKSPMEVNQVAQAICSLALSDYVGTVHVAGAAMSIYDFYRAAMSSLAIPSVGLYPALMPPDLPHPRDTSLDSSLMKRLLGIEPLSVQMALDQGY